MTYTYILTLFALSVLYLVTKTFYRLFLHPLSSIPGPKLGAVTSLYNAYYDILDTGLIKHLPALHAKYGPVIRIQPNEVHVASLEGYMQIHRVNTPFNRIWHNNPFLTGSLQSLTTLAETRKRRDFIAPFFSKSAISRAEPTLHGAKLRTFLTTLAGAQDTIVDFYLGFRCLTADLVMDYCFQSDLDALHSPSFTNHTISTMAQGSEMALVATFFPGLSSLLTALVFRLPESVRAAYFAPLYGFETMQNVARQKVEEALDRAHEPGQTRNMMDAMARPDAQRGQDRPSKRDMVADGCLMIAAGTDTTANTLGKILWHVTQDVRVQERLVEELKRGMGREEVLESARLEGEGFEYLRAVVKEGLRLSYGVPGRIIRRVPREGAKFGDVWVPGGVVVTSGIYMQNTDPAVFPEPFEFIPERWMCDAETYKIRDKHMLSFSRGSRSCIGMNLATATLNLTVAHLFRRFEITTTGYTTEKDMEWKDCFVPTTLGRIKGLVKIRSE